MAIIEVVEYERLKAGPESRYRRDSGLLQYENERMSMRAKVFPGEDPIGVLLALRAQVNVALGLPPDEGDVVQSVDLNGDTVEITRSSAILERTTG